MPEARRPAGDVLGGGVEARARVEHGLGAMLNRPGGNLLVGGDDQRERLRRVADGGEGPFGQCPGEAVPVDVPKRIGESQLGVYEGLDGDADDDLRGHR